MVEFNVPLPLASDCPLTCTQHEGHVYVVCFGQPVQVHDRDHLVGEQVRDYPINHYVGHTSGEPRRRLWTHGAGASRHVVAIVPGDLRKEELIKELEACPKCDRLLWYYGESPTPLQVVQVGDIVTRGERGRVRYLAAGRGNSVTELQRLGSKTRQVLSGLALERARSSLVVRWRQSGSYYAIQDQRQAALCSTPRTDLAALERLRVQAYRDVANSDLRKE